MGKILYFGKEVKYSNAKNSKLGQDIQKIKSLEHEDVGKVYKAIQKEAKGGVVTSQVVGRALSDLKGNEGLTNEELGNVSREFTGNSFVRSRRERSERENVRNMPVGFNKETNVRDSITKNTDFKKANPAPPRIRLAA